MKVNNQEQGLRKGFVQKCPPNIPQTGNFQGDHDDKTRVWDPLWVVAPGTMAAGWKADECPQFFGL
jgi:hypothetical protein